MLRSRPSVRARPSTRSPEAQGLTVETPEPFAKNAAIPGVGRSFPLTNALFALEPGKYTDVTAVEKKWAIARLDEKAPSTIPALEDVRAAVVGDFRREKGRGGREGSGGGAAGQGQ